MILRPAAQDDLPTLIEFEQGVIEEERPYNDVIRAANVKYYDLEAFLADAETSLQVAEKDGQIVGCGYAQLRPSNPAFIHDKHAYLGFMYVLPEFRGQGINRMIIESLIAWGADQGVSDFYLDVYAGNRAAIRAYEKAGFAASLQEMKLK